MRKTANYQLNQWDPEDRILREEFNGDNERIDAAIRGVADLCPYRIIRNITTAEMSSQVDVAVSDINFFNYAKIDILFQSPDYPGALRLRVNGLDRGYCYGHTSGYAGGDPMGTTHLANSFNFCYSDWTFYRPCHGRRVGCISISFDGGSSFSGYQTLAPVNWEDLSTLNFIGENIPAGSKFLICGVHAS